MSRSAGIGLAFALLLAGCPFDLPSGPGGLSFSCPDGRCPQGEACGSDGFCHTAPADAGASSSSSRSTTQSSGSTSSSATSTSSPTSSSTITSSSSTSTSSSSTITSSSSTPTSSSTVASSSSIPTSSSSTVTSSSSTPTSSSSTVTSSSIQSSSASSGSSASSSSTGTGSTSSSGGSSNCVAVGYSSSGATPEPAAQLIDIHWDCAQGQNQELKTGAAAVGNSTDTWNPAGSQNVSPFTTPTLVWANGAVSGVTAQSNNLGGCYSSTPPFCDPLLESYTYSQSGTTATVELLGLAAGTYDIYSYCAAYEGLLAPLLPTDMASTGFGINVYAGDAADAGLRYSLPPELTSPNWTLSPVWTEGVEYVESSGVCVIAGDRVEVALSMNVGSGGSNVVLNGMQILQTSTGSCKPPAPDAG